MKKYILILPVLLACLALQTSCKQNTSPSGPEEEEPLTEIVYGDTASANATCPQYDIDWPSLADSPWPMAVVDQQGLSRSQVPVLTQGGAVWDINLQDVKEITTELRYGCAVGPDGTVYVMELGYLTAIGPDGDFKWVTPDSLSVSTAPIIGSDSTIYFGCRNWPDHDVMEGGFAALRPDGCIKWIIRRSENFTDNRPFMGIDGTLYARTEEGILYAFNQQGDVLWQTQVAPPAQNIITASPDGSVLYLRGPVHTMVAMDAFTGDALWSVWTGIVSFTYASIDNQGNIYYYRAATDSTREIVSLTNDGRDRWTYSIDGIYESAADAPPDDGVSIAYNGFLYMGFAWGNVYALDYNGHFRWNYALIAHGNRMNGNSRAIICDNQGCIVHADSEFGVVTRLTSQGSVLVTTDLNTSRIRPCAVGSKGHLVIPYGYTQLTALQ